MKHLSIALSQYGIKEISGKEDNPEITKYFDALGFDGSKLKDETSWCAASAYWVLKEAGLEYQNKLNARSFLDIGEEVDTPQLGDIVVFWRGRHKDDTITGTSLKKGHVGFYINENETSIFVLGGNQSNQFKIITYPKYKVLGYRRLI